MAGEVVRTDGDEESQALSRDDGIHTHFSQIWGHAVSSVLSACNICQPKQYGDSASEDQSTIGPGWLAGFYDRSVEDEETQDGRSSYKDVSREGQEDLLATLMGSTEADPAEFSAENDLDGHSRFSKGSDKRLLSIQDADGVSSKSAKSSFRSHRNSSRNVRLGVQYDEEEDMFKHMTNDKFPVLVPQCVDDDFDVENPEHMKRFEEQFAPKIQDSAAMARSLGAAPRAKAITDHDVNLLMKGFTMDSNYDIRIARAKGVTEEAIEFQNQDYVTRTMENFNKHLTRSGLQYAESQQVVNSGMNMNYRAIFLERDPHFNRHASASAGHNFRLKRKETTKKLPRGHAE